MPPVSRSSTMAFVLCVPLSMPRKYMVGGGVLNERSIIGAAEPGRQPQIRRERRAKCGVAAQRNRQAERGRQKVFQAERSIHFHGSTRYRQPRKPPFAWQSRLSAAPFGG